MVFKNTYDSVVDVGGPDSREEQQTDVSEVVHRQNEQTNHIRRRLPAGTVKVERE